MSLKNWVLALMILTGFIFVASLATFYVQTEIERGNIYGCTVPIPIFIPMFSSLGLFVGSMVYYFMFPKIEERKENRIELFRKLLSLLEEDEKLVFEELIENDGEVQQSKLSRKIGKVKAFRVIEKLKRKGVIEKEKYGKTNVIKLKEELRKLIF